MCSSAAAVIWIRDSKASDNAQIHSLQLDLDLPCPPLYLEKKDGQLQEASVFTLHKLSAPHTLLLRTHNKTSRPMDLTETRESWCNKHVFITRCIPTFPLSQDEIDLLHSFHVHGYIDWEIIIVYGERKEVKSSTQAHFRRNTHTRQVTELWI